MLDGVLLGARIVLASLFAVAGASKLVDRGGTRAAVAAFGVPERLVAPTALCLPVVELAAAALITGAPTATAGAALALGLLVTVSAAVARALANRVAVECSCFGQLRAGAISRWTLVRNATIAAVAAFVLAAGPGPGTGLWSIVPVGVPLAALSFSAWRPRRPGLGLPPGAPLPAVTLSDLDGAPLELRDEIRRETVLLLWRPGCRPCRPLHDAILAWERDSAPEAPALVVVSLGTAADVAPEGFRSSVLLDADASARSALRAPEPPAAVRVDARRRIASPIATSDEAVLRLLCG